MAINKAMYNGVNAIMDAYDRNAQTPYYSVWAGKDMIFSYNEDDMEQGRVHLMENLIACEQNEHSDILKIKFHPKKEKLFITDRTPAIATLFVRVTDPNYLKGQVQQYQPSQNQYAINTLIEKQLELMQGMNNRLALLEEAQQDTEDYEEEATEDDVLGKIGALLSNPMVNQLLGLLVPTLAGKLMQAAPAINGVPEETLIEDKIDFVEDLDNEDAVKQIENLITDDLVNSLLRLKKHDQNIAQSLAKLADMADENPGKFKMLITYL